MPVSAGGVQSWWLSSFEGEPITAALGRRDFGPVFRLLRRRGWSVAELARATGMGEYRIREIAAGRRRVTAFDVIVRITEGLGIPPGLCGLAGADGVEPLLRGGRVLTAQAQSRDTLLTLRRVLDAFDCPPDGATRSLPELQQATGDVVRLRLDSQYGRLGAVLPGLIPELTRVLQSSAGQRRAEAAKLLVQAYRAADAIADKLGLFDLSARIIELIRWAAGQSGDHLAVATAAYVRGETFFASADYATGRRVMERAADELLPESSRAAAAVYGALHMRAAVLAGRGGDAARAAAHVEEAQDAARGLSEGIYRGTVFGPASVQIHRLTLAVELHDVEVAVGIAGSWSPPDRLPAERRSHFFADAARAHAMAGALPHAMDALNQARTIAPEPIRSNPEVCALVRDLESRPGPVDAAVQEFASWLGQDRGASRSGNSSRESMT